MTYMGTPDVHCDTNQAQKAIWAKRIKNVPYCFWVWLSRKCNENEDTANKLYTLVTYIPVTTFKNLQTVKAMRTNFWFLNKVIKLQKIEANLHLQDDITFLRYHRPRDFFNILCRVLPCLASFQSHWSRGQFISTTESSLNTSMPKNPNPASK